MLIATVTVVVAAVLLWAAFRLWLTARRLDRLHKRTEAARAGCAEALGRRIVATRAVLATGHIEAPLSSELRRAVTAADGADGSHRDEAEAQLTALLTRLTIAERGGLHDELADAEERVALAVQFYNDAVRDTRALRSSWFTRFFRLAGRAALPEYFGA